MDTPLRVLLVEDSETDARLATIALRRAGYAPESERVEDAAALGAALDRDGWDVVLTQWSGASLGAIEVLAAVKRLRPEVPVIVISGTPGEDIAVDAMRAGAADFVLKHKLARLSVAVDRELRGGRDDGG